MSTELATRQQTAIAIQRDLTPAVMEMIRMAAPIMWRSRVCGVVSEEQAAWIAMMAFERGIPITAAPEFFQTIQNRITMSPRGAKALVEASGLLEAEKIDEESKDGKPYSCTVWMKRTNGREYRCTVTMNDARAAGLVKPNSGWLNWPANMLRWRCVGFVLDWLFSDVTAGMKRADEFGADITPDGDVIEGSWKAQELQPAALAPVEQPQIIKLGLQDIINQGFTAEQVLGVNGGRIPATDAEVEQVFLKLAGAA